MKFQNGGNGALKLRQGFSMKTPIVDTLFEVKHLKYITGFSEASFLSHLQASQAYRVNCVLNQCRQLGSSVRELIDKYPGSCLCLPYHDIGI